MRENRPSGSEGGVAQSNAPSLPLLRFAPVPRKRIGVNLRGFEWRTFPVSWLLEAARLLAGGAGESCEPIHRTLRGAPFFKGASRQGRRRRRRSTVSKVPRTAP